jgi:hypothetical protein
MERGVDGEEEMRTGGEEGRRGGEEERRLLYIATVVTYSPKFNNIFSRGYPSGTQQGWPYSKMYD